MTGGRFYDPKEDDPATATGSVAFDQISPKQIAVPPYYFMSQLSPVEEARLERTPAPMWK